MTPAVLRKRYHTTDDITAVRNAMADRLFGRKYRVLSKKQRACLDNAAYAYVVASYDYATYGP